MAETNLPVTPGSGANVAGNTDSAGYFQQAVTLGNGGSSANIIADNIPLPVYSEPFTFKDDFPGSTLNATNWTVTQASGTTTTYSVASSILTINASTTANDYIAFTSKQSFVMPARIQVALAISQRIANNNFYVELVNAAGTTVANLGNITTATGVTQAAWLFNNTTNTTNYVVAQNQGVKATADSGVTTSSTAGYVVFEIEARNDMVDYTVRSTDSNSVATTYASRNRTALTPNEAYFLQIRSVNGSTAPASNTTMTIESVLIQKQTMLPVEITGGRGNNSGAKDVPVFIQSANTLSIVPTTSSSAGGMTAYTNSALSNSVVQVKGSTGRIYDIYAYNPNSVIVYLQIFNALSASVTLGTTSPTLSYPLLPGAVWDKSFVAQFATSTGISIACTATRAGSTAPTTGIDVNIGYA